MLFAVYVLPFACWLMCVGCCVTFVAYYMLFNDWCLLFVVCVCCTSFIACRLLFVGCCLPFGVYTPFIVRCFMVVVCRLLYMRYVMRRIVVYCLMFTL